MLVQSALTQNHEHILYIHDCVDIVYMDIQIVRVHDEKEVAVFYTIRI